MNNKAHSHRPLSRKEYEAAIAQLKVEHPWLAKQVVQPAPGHLGVLAYFIREFENLMRPIDYRRSYLFCATHPREKLSVRVEVRDATIERERAFLDLMDQARLAAQQHCPVCGAPVFGGDSNAPAGVRCGKHKDVLGLFSEDIRRFHIAARAHKKANTEQAEPVGVSKVAYGADSEATEAEIAALMDMPKTGPIIEFLRSEGLRQFVDRHKGKAEEKYKRAQAIAERIRKAGNDRRHLGVLPDSWEPLVEEFVNKFPNFSELAELLRDNFALHALGDRRVSWSPILLVGPPGIGKTEAARWLADQLRLPFQVFDMAAAQSGSPLAGSEAFWANSEPGLLFELLAYQPTANPIALLDELDKAQETRQYDPLAALYTLLEQRSARSFIDLSIRDFWIDASHVNWIATANSADGIPAPLLSRMTVLHVRAPTPEQVGRIAQSIYGRMRAEARWGSAFAPTLDAQVVDRLKALPPRSLGIELRRALGRAARAERNHILANDIQPAVPVSERGIGFTWAQP